MTTTFHRPVNSNQPTHESQKNARFSCQQPVDVYQSSTHKIFGPPPSDREHVLVKQMAAELSSGSIGSYSEVLQCFGEHHWQSLDNLLFLLEHTSDGYCSNHKMRHTRSPLGDDAYEFVKERVISYGIIVTEQRLGEGNKWKLEGWKITVHSELDTADRLFALVDALCDEMAKREFSSNISAAQRGFAVASLLHVVQEALGMTVRDESLQLVKIPFLAADDLGEVLRWVERLSKKVLSILEVSEVHSILEEEREPY